MAGDPGHGYAVAWWAGTPELGLWCTKCALPSGISVPLYLVSILGVSLGGHFRRCGDCGATL